MYIDTHTHLYDEQLTIDDDAAIDRALAAGVGRMYMPNCDSTTIEGMMRIARKYPDNCFPMMGLHPCYVKEHYRDELTIVEKQLAAERFYAVGEIGLDFYWDLTFKAQQYEAFERQIDLALQYDLPIVIHSRESTDECIDVVRKKQNGKLTGVFHCFGGTKEQAAQIADLGFYLGIGGVITFKKAGLQDVVKETPLEHIVLETDAPYLAPTPYRGKRNESAYTVLVAQKIAELKGIALEEVAKITTENAEKLFKY